MNAQEAIVRVNDAKLLLPIDELTCCATVITRAALMKKDEDAIRWLLLLHWKPQQLVN